MPSVWMSDESGGLVALQAAEYPTERELQAFIADHPEVLATALGDEDAAPWLLIRRELPITMDDGDDRTRWSLDHLFIDAEGTPTLVEVKRSSDPRSRREVIAQMLDYAASFRRDWTAESLRAVWTQEETAAGNDPETVIDAFLAGAKADGEDTFWGEVQTRIAGNRLRLLFVADRLSSHVVRIIEYLNEQLQTTEVLGLEVAPHIDSQGRVIAYVPTVRGRTAAVPPGKQPSERRTRREFEDALRTHHGDGAVASVNRVVEAIEAFGGFAGIGTDARNPRLFLNFRLPSSGRVYCPLSFNSRAGKVTIRLRWLARLDAFSDEAVRAEFVSRLSDAVGTAIDAPRLDGFPGFPVEALAKPGAVDGVVDVLRWVTEVAAAPPADR